MHIYCILDGCIKSTLQGCGRLHATAEGGALEAAQRAIWIFAPDLATTSFIDYTLRVVLTLLY